MPHNAHPHGHHDHHAPVECDEVGAPEYYALATAALKEILIEKGYFTTNELRREIEMLQQPDPTHGARIVARAWADPVFKARLMADGAAAARELGIDFKEAQLVVVENTSELHNLVTCTLCSCYPRSVLGQPPAWYTSRAYRARSVSDPRTVLADLGWTPLAGVSVRVHDSNADMRYLVLPMRPTGAEGWSEEQLAELVTRDSMIGVAPAREPGRVRSP